MATYTEMMEYIDNVVLHEREYDAIRLLLDNSDPRFFTKILEEIVDGNLFWTDFYPLLDIPEYRDRLKVTFESQRKLAYNIKNFTEFRKTINMSEEPTHNNIGISVGETGYDTLAENDHENRLYDLLQYSANDNIFSISCKKAIYNAVENYRYLISDENTQINNDANINSFGELKYGENYYDYLDPMDILFSQDDIIIPIEYEHQVITAHDRDFMMEHNMSEDEMKKIKALSMFLKKNSNRGGDA